MTLSLNLMNWRWIKLCTPPTKPFLPLIFPNLHLNITPIPIPPSPPPRNPMTPLLLTHPQTHSVFLTSLVTLWCLWNRVPTHSLLQDSRLLLLSTICLAGFQMAMWLLAKSPKWLVVTATNVTTQEMTVGLQLLKMGVLRRNNYFFLFFSPVFLCNSKATLKCTQFSNFKSLSALCRNPDWRCHWAKTIRTMSAVHTRTKHQQGC